MDAKTKAKQTTRRQRQGRQASSSGMRIGSELKGNLWARIAAWLHYRTPLTAGNYCTTWRGVRKLLCRQRIGQVATALGDVQAVVR
jgi:hypothetical protein